MGPHRVVVLEPSLGLLPYMVEIGEDPSVEDTITVTAIETFDESVLGRFAWLDELEFDAVADAPGGEDGTGELGAVIDT